MLTHGQDNASMGAKRQACTIMPPCECARVVSRGAGKAPFFLPDTLKATL